MEKSFKIVIVLVITVALVSWTDATPVRRIKRGIGCDNKGGGGGGGGGGGYGGKSGGGGDSGKGGGGGGGGYSQGGGGGGGGYSQGGGGGGGGGYSQGGGGGSGGYSQSQGGGGGGGGGYSSGGGGGGSGGYGGGSSGGEQGGYGGGGSSGGGGGAGGGYGGGSSGGQGGQSENSGSASSHDSSFTMRGHKYRGEPMHAHDYDNDDDSEGYTPYPHRFHSSYSNSSRKAASLNKNKPHSNDKYGGEKDKDPGGMSALASLLEIAGLSVIDNEDFEVFEDYDDHIRKMSQTTTAPPLEEPEIHKPPPLPPMPNRDRVRDHEREPGLPIYNTGAGKPVYSKVSRIPIPEPEQLPIPAESVHNGIGEFGFGMNHVGGFGHGTPPPIPVPDPADQNLLLAQAALGRLGFYNSGNYGYGAPEVPSQSYGAGTGGGGYALQG